MIDRNEVLKIGRLQKTFGIRGEITLLYDKRGYAGIDTEYYFLEIEGILVPFFIDEIVYTNDTTARVKFADVEDEKQASRYAHLSVYLLREMLSSHTGNDEGPDWDYFVGFSVFNQHLQELGIIETVDSSTLNVLFVVQKGNAQILIPAAEDFVLKIDDKKKIIYLNLPEGLIE